jgi:hypothetical protein
MSPLASAGVDVCQQQELFPAQVPYREQRDEVPPLHRGHPLHRDRLLTTSLMQDNVVLFRRIVQMRASV